MPNYPVGQLYKKYPRVFKRFTKCTQNSIASVGARTSSSVSVIAEPSVYLMNQSAQACVSDNAGTVCLAVAGSVITIPSSCALLFVSYLIGKTVAYTTSPILALKAFIDVKSRKLLDINTLNTNGYKVVEVLGEDGQQIIDDYFDDIQAASHLVNDRHVLSSNWWDKYVKDDSPLDKMIFRSKELKSKLEHDGTIDRMKCVVKAAQDTIYVSGFNSSQSSKNLHHFLTQPICQNTSGIDSDEQIVLRYFLLLAYIVCEKNLGKRYHNSLLLQLENVVFPDDLSASFSP